MKNILITGGQGFIGKELTSFLLKNNDFYIYNINRKLSEKNNKKNVEYLNVNFENLDQYNKIFNNIECVIHLAFPYFKKTIDKKTIEDQVKKNIKFIIFLKKHNIKRFIYFSTAKLINFNYKSKLRNHNGYEICKINIEDLFKKELLKLNIDLIILRVGVVYGYNTNSNFNKLVHYIKKGLPIPLLKSDVYKSIICIDDLLENIRKIITYNNKINKTYYLYEKNIKIGILVKKINLILGNKDRLFYIPNIIYKILQIINLDRFFFGSLYDSFQSKENNFFRDFDYKPNEEKFIINLKKYFN